VKHPRIRALVLTAGFGTRLRPLNRLVPKPLLPICGEPVAGHTLRRLAEAGCEAAALNLHHLPEAVPKAFGQSYWGLPLVYSREEEEIQGTLGALYPLREFLRRSDAVVLVNGDALCRWPFEKLVRRHLSRKADATLLVHGRADPGAFGGGIGLGADGRVVQLRDAPAVGEVTSRRVFTGAHVLSPRLLERVAEGPGDIVEGLYQPLLAEGGTIETLATRQTFFDLGTPERYLAAATSWPCGRSLFGLRKKYGVVSALADAAPENEIERSLIVRGARVGEGSRIERSILLEGALVGAGSAIQHCIVGPGVELPPSSAIEGRMITPEKCGHNPTAQESVLGGLIYTPI